MTVTVHFTLNGAATSYLGPPLLRLLDHLRENALLKGTKEGCGEGECGLCTVLFNGRPVNACLTSMIQLEAADIWTVEGLTALPETKRLAENFAAMGAAQCGICTPGMLVAGVALLRDPAFLKSLDKPEYARQGLAGNLCRCTGYQKIIEAVVRTAEQA